MTIVRIAKYLLTLAMFVVLTGCVAGQSIKMDYHMADNGAKLNGSAMVMVNDDRPFIVDGNKPPSYIGHFRAGFGNTWGVTTYKDEPLAEKMRKDLTSDLQAMGLSVQGGSGRVVDVSIVDWNFDSYQNARFWYDIRVKVMQGETVIAENHLKDEHVIRGSVMTGPKNAVMREMPIIYNSIIRKIVRESETIRSALQ